MMSLVVDPSTTIRRIAALVLFELGFTEVTEARDGREAASAVSPSVSMVIAERDAPGFDSLEFVRRLKADGSPKIVMVSSRNARDEVLEAMHAGIDAYLLKPFTRDALRRQLVPLIEVIRGASEGETSGAGNISEIPGIEDLPSEMSLPDSPPPEPTDALAEPNPEDVPGAGEPPETTGEPLPAPAELQSGSIGEETKGSGEPPEQDLDKAA